MPYRPPQKDIPREHYNGLPYPDGWKHYPDGDMRRCQCVNNHAGEEGGISQCGAPRNPGSDLYCGGCEAVHGKAYLAEIADKKRRGA